MTKEKFSKIQEAGGVLCGYCLGEDCSACMVQNLIERAEKDANIDLMGNHNDDEPEVEDCNTYRESEYNDNGTDTRTGEPFGIHVDPDQPAIEVCEYETAERFFVYDKNDDCVSDGFLFEDDAIAFANKTGNPVVKVHTYFIDSDRGGKLYPDGEPTIVWKNGRPV